MKRATIFDEQKDLQMREDAKFFVNRLYASDRNMYNASLKLADELGVGGLWQGAELAIMHIAKALITAKGGRYNDLER